MAPVMAHWLRYFELPLLRAVREACGKRSAYALCNAGDQADVLMWRLIGFVHLLLANITQNLEVRSNV